MCTKNAFHDAYIAYKRDNTILRFLKNPEKITKNPGIPEKLEKSRDSGINPGRWQRCPHTSTICAAQMECGLEEVSDNGREKELWEFNTDQAELKTLRQSRARLSFGEL